MNTRTCWTKFVFSSHSDSTSRAEHAIHCSQGRSIFSVHETSKCRSFVCEKDSTVYSVMSMSENAETNIDTANSYSVSTIQSTRLQPTEKQETTDWHFFIQRRSKKDKYFIRRSYHSSGNRTRSIVCWIVRYFLPLRFVTCTSGGIARFFSYRYDSSTPFRLQGLSLFVRSLSLIFSVRGGRISPLYPNWFDPHACLILYIFLLMAVMGTFPCRQVSCAKEIPDFPTFFCETRRTQYWCDVCLFQIWFLSMQFDIRR